MFRRKTYVKNAKFEQERMRLGDWGVFLTNDGGGGGGGGGGRRREVEWSEVI
jgi:hypothetical protein